MNTITYQQLLSIIKQIFICLKKQAKAPKMKISKIG